MMFIPCNKRSHIITMITGCTIMQPLENMKIQDVRPFQFSSGFGKESSWHTQQNGDWMTANVSFMCVGVSSIKLKNGEQVLFCGDTLGRPQGHGVISHCSYCVGHADWCGNLIKHLKSPGCKVVPVLTLG